MNLQRGGQRGQTLVMFAVVLALLFIGLLALIADLGAVYTSYSRAENVALLAAQAGASQINQQDFYNGVIDLDASAAPARCAAAIQAGNLPNPAYTCKLATPTQITVTIKYNVQLPLPLPGTSAPIQVTESAETVYGDTVGRKA
jgi:Flp pilus assembly protein TadG